MSNRDPKQSDEERLVRLERMLDRQDILDCLTRFSRGIDRLDRDLFLSAFFPDATIAAGPFVGNADALYAWASAMHQQGQFATHHNLLNHSCQIDGDIADVAHRAQLFAQINKHGELDLLVNNASTLGPTPLRPLAALSPAELLNLLSVNVIAPFALTAALPLSSV